MNVLIVYTHPETKSFNRALLDRSVEELASLGHAVKVSDLYAMQFNPVASEKDFHQRRFPDVLHYDREQKYSHTHQSFSDDIAPE